MARQQRHFAWDYAKSRTAGASAGWSRKGARQDLIERSSEVEVHLSTRLVLEDQEHRAAVTIEAGLRGPNHRIEWAGGQ